MKIHEIHISGYKSLKEILMDDISNLTVLIGENGSGKSNLLEAISLFSNSFKEDIATESVTPEFPSYFWYRKNTGTRIKFDFTFEFDEVELTLILGSLLYESIPKRVKKALRKVRVQRELDYKKGWIRKTVTLGKTPIIKGGVLVKLVDFIEGVKIQLPYKLTKVEVIDENQQTVTIDVLNRKKDPIAYIPQLEDLEPFLTAKALVVDTAQTKDYPSWLSARGINSVKSIEEWDEFKLDNIDKISFRIMALLFSSLRMVTPPSISFGKRSLIEPEILENTRKIGLSGEYNDEEEWNELRQDFESEFRGTLTTKGDEILVEEGGRSYPVESMGSGHQSWLRLLREFSHGSRIITIEEPESHLHPSLCRHVFHYIKNVSENSQVFLTTHSPIFVDRTHKKNNWVIELDNGESHIYRFEDFTKALSAIGAKPSDRFMAESILLVEGISDKIFFEACASKMKLNMDELLIVPVHGKSKTRRNLDAWAPVILGTQVKLHILLDRDALCVIKTLVKRGVLEESDYSVLPFEIEDEYPKDLLEKAMETLFDVTFDAMDPISPPRKDFLEKKISEKGPVPKGWNVSLAENVGELITKDRIPKAIIDLVKKMKQK